jgi:hypothetical protein
METRMYVCQYCRREYLPKRRRVQKFCSESCRSNSHQLKKKLNQQLVPTKTTPDQESIKVDKMSFAGVGNSVAGTLAVETLKSLFTSEENKPATKSDIKNLERRFNRYQEIKNIPRNIKNQKPYYDSVQKIVVYL